VVRLDNDRVTAVQFLTDQRCDVAKVHQSRYPHAVAFRDEPEIISRIVRDREWLEIDIADPNSLSPFCPPFRVLKNASSVSREI
jgi:hypothetical protein